MTKEEVDVKNAKADDEKKAKAEADKAVEDKKRADAAKKKAADELERKEASYPVHVGDPVVVKGFKAHSDGTNESPGLVNGVTLNPTAKEVSDLATAAGKLTGPLESSDTPREKNIKIALSIPPDPHEVTAEVSPASVDVALFPRNASMRNVEGIAFFTSKKAAEAFYDLQPEDVKLSNGPKGCVAYPARR